MGITHSTWCCFLIVKKDGENIDYIVSSTIGTVNNKFIYHVGINRLPSYIIRIIFKKILFLLVRFFSLISIEMYFLKMV